MKTALRVLVLLFVCTVIACLLFPGIYHIWVVRLGWVEETPRIFRRVWMITIAAGLILFRRSLGLEHPAKVGFTVSRQGFWNFAVGFAVACSFLGILSAAYLLTGAWHSKPIDAGYVFERFYQGLLQGVLVALIEEYLFRGLIFFSLARRWGWLRAAVFTSLIFASLHFFEGRGLETAAFTNSWTAGFELCGMLFTNMAREFTFFPDAVGLFCVGFILCHAAYSTGSLWYPAGLHGGWVFYSKFKAAFFDSPKSLDFIIGGGRMFDGIVPMICMFVIFPVSAYLAHKRFLSIQPVRMDGEGPRSSRT